MSSASTRRITRPKGPFASPCSCARAASAATAPRAAASSSDSSPRARRCARRSATSTDSSRTRVRLHFMALRFRRFYPTCCELACGPLSPRERLPGTFGTLGTAYSQRPRETRFFPSRLLLSENIPEKDASAVTDGETCRRCRRCLRLSTLFDIAEIEPMTEVSLFGRRIDPEDSREGGAAHGWLRTL